MTSKYAICKCAHCQTHDWFVNMTHIGCVEENRAIVDQSYCEDCAPCVIDAAQTPSVFHKQLKDTVDEEYRGFGAKGNVLEAYFNTGFPNHFGIADMVIQTKIGNDHPLYIKMINLRKVVNNG